MVAGVNYVASSHRHQSVDSLNLLQLSATDASSRSLSDAATASPVPRYLASIDLASPDPGAVPLPESRRSTVSSDTGSVTFRPDQVRPESLVGTKAPAQLKIEPGEVRPDPTASEPPRTARATVQKVEL